MAHTHTQKKPYQVDCHALTKYFTFIPVSLRIAGYKYNEKL